MRRLVAHLGTICVIAAAHGNAVAAASGCDVSKPAPIKGRTGFNVGTLRLAASLPKTARYVAVPDGRPGSAFVEKSGRIRVKLGWLSPSGRPRAAGRRLDATAAPLKVDMGVKSFSPDGQFYPSHLYFPTTGCWLVTASNARIRLTFTVEVVGP